ncbi:U4/U6.U5 Tri-Snrnp-Associated Protein 1 [Manis pentadactyla]|nr:U4/U6.U5 Tri-Snrnp-Associated Protein 1 [Manis pentadactyla]
MKPMALRQREEVRENLAAAKEKHLLNQKLGKGLTVEHAIESFCERETVSLILKDKGVLQEKEGVLVNVKLVKQDRALWRKKPVCLPYAEHESVDDLSQ